MTNRNRKRGRPPKFVEDPNGRPIVGLSYNKTTGSYYATYSKPRVWFGSDFGQALFNFRRYHNQQAIEQPYVEIQTPFSPDEIGTRIVKWSELCGEPPVIAAAYAGDSALLPESMFLETVRNFILKDPISAARKIGIPELARLEDLPPLERPLSLEKVLQYYLDRRKPSKDESRKMESVWKEFRGIVKMSTVREISSDMIHDYCDLILAEYEEKGWANSWLKARFSRVKTLFNYYFKHGRTNKRDLSRLIEYCKCLSVPASVEESAQPIEKEHVHQLLSHCDTKWRAIVLLALNCGYYAKDIHDIQQHMIKHRKGLDYIVFPREKNKHTRVNVLWAESKQALDEYLAKRKRSTNHIFSSQFGTQLASHDVQRCFGRLRKKADVPDSVKFSHFRDGAASALFGKVQSDMLKVTIGHRIKGEKSKYISVRPEQVKVCADVIYEEYFA